MIPLPEVGRCPDCGSELVSEPGLPGLCPQCLLSLALQESPAPGRYENEAATLARPAPGRILGERYQVREVLGRGGMGEVFRAFDLKLRVEVALKAVRVDQGGSDRAREMLRGEVRSAREVVSPNVCRIFDLVVEDGQELVSMEYIDGVTLGETLKTRGPLALEEAREIASQFLSGLEAIHQAGLVHRDFKPENVMLTRAGRVVVMDFGLAKARAETGTGTISGTPAYMAPEQARGEAVDARADVYAAGMVLAEMLSVGGSGHFEARQALWRAARETPPRVPDGPWAGVLRDALSPNPEERPGSARALARSLEEVTQRLPGFETKRPYPGLASFTEEDAEYFFGREVEVEAVWRKLKRPRMLALIAPSGAGKSSFLRAGLLPTLPKGWKALIATPGNRPFQALARTLVPVFAGDTQATEALFHFEEADTAVSLFHRFRQRHEHALLVLDQFEELFTLSPREVQDAFAKLLGRLVLEADLHVILSLRDDFLFRCQDHAALVPAFSDLTPLPTLIESGLRRALVQPALSCGYRFEDEALVDEMVAEVQKERGALPLLAFAASRLWETRDREKGQLTRQAYKEIGGVAGALAQHAEATLERIGAQRTPLVREIFRNLVTAQGTRAVRERWELLSVFEKDGNPATHAQAEVVLSALVDARLITSYERPGEAGESHHQVEIIHESLLSAWPRLVRWQTQDADGAQLRDQLRQAAQLWQDRGQTEDLLWSGQAYRDFALWRERYPAPLSATEDAFTRGMEANAVRRRRRRQAAVVTLVGVATAVALVTSVLWQRAEDSRRRAEAGKLVVLGDRELERYPTAALAYAIASLEVADSEEARILGLRAIQSAPVARIAKLTGGDTGWAGSLDFSPSGKWVATGGYQKAELLHRDGQQRLVLGDYASAGQGMMSVRFSPGSDVLATNLKGDVRLWSVPEGRVIGRGQPDGGFSGLERNEDGFVTLTTVGQRAVVRLWPFGAGEPRLVGLMEALWSAAVAGDTLAFPRGRNLYLRSLAAWSRPARYLAGHASEIQAVTLGPGADQLAASDASGQIRIWPTTSSPRRPLRVLEGRDTPGVSFDSTGRWLAASGKLDGSPTVRLFDLKAPSVSEGLVLQRPDQVHMNEVAFDSRGEWLATAHAVDVALWWLGDAYPGVLTRNVRGLGSLAFTPDGRWLLTASAEGLRAWPFGQSESTEPRTLLAEIPDLPSLAIDPKGRNAVVGGERGRVRLVPINGGAARDLEGFSEKSSIGAVAFGDGGRLVAAVPYIGPREEKVIRVWNLETGAVQVLGPVPGAGDGFEGGTQAGSLTFMNPDRILVASKGSGMVDFDLRSGRGSVLHARPNLDFHLSHDRKTGVGWHTTRPLSDSLHWDAAEFLRFDVETGRAVPLPSRGAGLLSVAFEETDRLLASSVDGTIRVGPVTGGEPHLLLGHRAFANSLAFSPDGRWLASSSMDGTVRLWPLPDVTKPPLHKRPYAELLTVLRSHTNLRAVPDAGSRGGYKLEPGPFPGWARPPER